MLTADFKGMALPRLGFGAMRLPQLEGGAIDEAQVNDMIAYCMEHGVNYFDTAYPYHGGMSELVLAKALAPYPREDYFLANKYPGHQIADEYDPADIFEEQLRKCGVEYFDFYLLHNVYEKSLPVYLDERWGIVDYFAEQVKNGRIKHLGFSTHGSLSCMEDFLDACGEHMEFCQIQMNYLDWDVQKAREKVEMLQARGLPVWVMESVRGGMLCSLSEENMALIAAANTSATPFELAMRWQLDKPSTVVLTGSSNTEQLQQNIAVWEEAAPLTAAEQELVASISANMRDDVPCTACRYCCDSCPQELDIPYLMEIANEVRVAPSFNGGMRLDALEEGKRPQDCIACRACEAMCPQSIEISQVIADIVERQKNVPHWEDLCRARAEAARKLREQQA